MYINLSGLNILVTGSSRGIGRAVATKLAEAGATIAIHYNKNVREAENLAHTLGNESKAFQADLSQPNEAANLFDRIILEMGSIEILVNNAGIAIPAPMQSAGEAWQKAWDTTMMVNLNSPAILCKMAVEHFLKRKYGGRIINISNRANFRGRQAEYLAYSASKEALTSVTKSLARTYGKDGVKSFVVAPGFVQTDMAREFLEMQGEEQNKKSTAILERMTEPKDLAPLITFIASGMADHSTGSIFDVNIGNSWH